MGVASERPGPGFSGAPRGRGVRPLKARFRATAGLVEDRESTERRSCPKKAAVLASVLGEAAGADWCASLSFADARTEEGGRLSFDCCFNLELFFVACVCSAEVQP